MDPIALALLPVLALAIAGLARFALRRRRERQAEESRSAQRRSPMQFETTMGELRDMREALRPAERAAAARLPARTGRPLAAKIEGN